jgi:cytochrome b561
MSETAKAPRRNNVFKQLMSVHWWMALLYLILFVGGITMERLPQGNLHDFIYSTHKSFGVLVLLFLAWRLYLLVIVWGKKYLKHFPRLTGNWYFKTGLHTLLYVLMIAVPLSGYWLSNSVRPQNISLFGLPMPDIFPENGDAVGEAAAAHGRSSKIFLGLIFIHIVARYKVVKANWHRLTDWVKKVSTR